MNKKITLVFTILIICMVACIVTYRFKALPKENSNNNSDINVQMTIGNINNVSLYYTDYSYNKDIKGYVYTLVNLSSEDINNIKEGLKDIELRDNIKDIVYGQYKLVLDDKTIFFDSNTDSALYLEKNITFKLPNSIKKKFISNDNTCSCCTTSECKINLCGCNGVNN